MSDKVVIAAAAPASVAVSALVALPAGLQRRSGGLFFDIKMAPQQLLAAMEQVFLSGAYLPGLDYRVLTRALYQTGPGLRPYVAGGTLVRLAADVLPFPAARRALYKLIKINNDEAAYYFEPILLEGSGETRLDADEFVADMWCKGLRFGIDMRTVRAAIDSGKAERITVARSLAPAPGRDAQIVETGSDMHRDDAPRERADGRLDLLSFKNRFPHVRKHARLLKKIPSLAGQPGYDLSGAILQPEPPLDIDLSAMAGQGTAVELRRDGEFLVARQDGFINLDSAGKIAIDSSIVSRDGVSSRTTGNLTLRAAYEEYGEVQEQRSVDGSDITIHGNVFGHLHSHGGDIVLRANLVGGAALNDSGNIQVEGVASAALLQSADGAVHVQRAEGCVISGARVVIGYASNCDIIADEVVIEVAQGCAVAGRSVEIGSAGPRRQMEMLVFSLVPDMTVFDRKIADCDSRADAFGKAVVKRQLAIGQIGNQPEVRSYLTLAGQLRRQQVSLSPAQMAPFQKLASAVAPALKELGRLRLEVKQLEILEAQMFALARQTVQDKKHSASQSRCRIRMVDGDTVVRTMEAGAGKFYQKPQREIKARLRSVNAGIDVIFAGASGELDWTYQPPEE